jgi:hypothetical protein
MSGQFTVIGVRLFARSLFLGSCLTLFYPLAANAQTLSEVGWDNEPITAQVETLGIFLPRFGAQLTTASEVGNNSSYGSVYGWFPFSTTASTSLGFGETRLNFETESDRISGNFLLGYRQLLPESNAAFGTYLGYDFRNTGNTIFQQIDGGLEWLSESWEMRINAYIPVGRSRRLVAEQLINRGISVSHPYFENHFLAVTQRQVIQRNRFFEAALAGFDFEVGTRLYQWDNGDVRSYLGTYLYGGEGTASYLGLRSRLVARYNNTFNASLTLQTDGKFGTNLILGVGTSWGGFRSNSDLNRHQHSLFNRLASPILRQHQIAVDRQFESEFIETRRQIILTNPATQQPWRFLHVTPGGNNGNGTVESPFSTIIAATNRTRSDGNDIIYVQTGSNPGLDGFTIPDFVRVLSTGPQQFINTIELGQLQLLGSGNGVFPSIVGTVTMGNQTLLSGFAIAGQTNAGVVARNISSAVIRDNMIESPIIAGVLLENTTGTITLERNRVTGNTVPALIANNIENASVIDSNLSSFNSASNGITLNGIRGNFKLANTTVNIQQPINYGVQVSQVTGTVNLTATAGSRIANPGTAGALLTNNTTFSGFAIDAAGQNGIIANSVRNLSIRDNQIVNANNGIDLQNMVDNVSVFNNRISQVNNGIYIQGSLANATISGNQIVQASNGINLQDFAGAIAVLNNQISQTVDRGINLGVIENQTTVTIANNQISELSATGRGISVDQIQNNARATLNIANNRISNIGDEGIYINDIQDNAEATITISGNIIENTGQEGMQIDFIEDNAIANITISGNTIRDVGANQEGIYFNDIQDNARVNLTISGNVIERVGSRAIAFDLIEVNATPTITIENNQINTTGDQGIYFDDIENTVNANITISGNAIANTGADSIQFDIIEDSAIATLQVINNTFSNSTQDGLEIEHTSNNNLCLVLSGNTATGIVGNGFNFISTGTGQFQIVDRANINTNNTGTFNPNNIAINPNFSNGNLGTLPCPSP